MTTELIARYQSGGDLFDRYQALYGTAGAEAIAQAARTGDRTEITNAIDRVRFGPRESSSTAGEFGRLITTDPFGAPLQSANTALENTVGSALRGVVSNPWVLLAVAALVIHWLGLWPAILRQLKAQP